MDQKGEIGAATEVDRAEVDRVEAATVDDGITAVVEGTIENTPKIAHTKTFRYDREADIRIGIIETKRLTFVCI